MVHHFLNSRQMMNTVRLNEKVNSINGRLKVEFKNAYYLKNPEKTVSTGSFNDILLKNLLTDC